MSTSSSNRQPAEPGPPAAAGDELLVLHAFARLDARAMGLSLGLVLGLGLFLATAVLLLRAGLDPAGPVGPHLQVLGRFLPGYAVTWAGSLIGFGYGFTSGFVLGLAMAALLNLNHYFYLTLLRRRLRRREFFVEI